MSKYLLLLFLYIPIFSGLYYFNQLVWILEFTLWAIMYLTIFYFFHVVWSRFRKRDHLYIIEYAKKFYISLGTIIFLTVGILAWFWYYQLEYKPLALNQITLSNWDKTVVFQKMIHIAKPNYYNSISQEIENYKNQWFVYFFEWVKPGTEENSDNFNAALWIEFEADLYDNLSKLYALEAQNNLQFLWIVNNKDYNVDMNIDEIIWEYKDLKVENNITNEYSPAIDINGEIVTALAQLNSRQLEVLQFVNLTFLTTITKNEDFLQKIQNNFWNELLFQVILEWRNQVIVDAIIDSKDKNIFATYWALHFKWVLEWLQEKDANWKIVSEKPFFPFQ